MAEPTDEIRSSRTRSEHELWKPSDYKVVDGGNYWRIVLPDGSFHGMIFATEDGALAAVCMHRALVEEHAKPIPMLLWCPECGTRHIDIGEFAHKPHHTHACQNCGMTWRPAVVATVGVRFLPGFKNVDPDALEKLVEIGERAYPKPGWREG